MNSLKRECNQKNNVKICNIGSPYKSRNEFFVWHYFYGSPKELSNHSRNVCIFAEGEVDRSPTGTGVSARAAIHYARGDISIGEPLPLKVSLVLLFQ